MLEEGKGIELFGVKGVVTENGENSKGPYAIIGYKQEDGTARHVKITWDGLTIVEFAKRVIGVEFGEDGSVKLLYDSGSAIQGTLIKSPSLPIKPFQVDVFVSRIRSDTTINDIWEQILDSKSNVLQKLGIERLEDFAKQLAYAVYYKEEFETKSMFQNPIFLPLVLL